jgi:hypothetical protein
MESSNVKLHQIRPWFRSHDYIWRSSEQMGLGSVFILSKAPLPVGPASKRVLKPVPCPQRRSQGTPSNVSGRVNHRSMTRLSSYNDVEWWNPRGHLFPNQFCLELFFSMQTFLTLCGPHTNKGLETMTCGYNLAMGKLGPGPPGLWNCANPRKKSATNKMQPTTNRSSSIQRQRVSASSYQKGEKLRSNAWSFGPSFHPIWIYLVYPMNVLKPIIYINTP